MEKPEFFLGRKEKINKALVKAEKLKELGPALSLMVGDFGYTIIVDSSAETAYFNHIKKTIAISPRAIVEMGFSEEEARLIIFHEGGHYVQMLQSPDEYLAYFEKHIERAREFPPELRQAAEKAWSRFYQVFTEIHAEGLARQRVPEVQKGRVQAERFEKKWPKNDLRHLPLIFQFLQAIEKHSITGKPVLPGKEKTISDKIEKEKVIIVSPQVYQALTQEFSLYGKRMIALDLGLYIFEKEIKYGSAGYLWEKFLGPLFESLLKIDLKKAKVIEQIKSTPGIEEEPGELPPGKIKEFIEGLKKSQMPASEREKEKWEEKLKELASGIGLSERETKELVMLFSETNHLVDQVAKIWENFLFLKSTWTREKKEAFKSGLGVSSKALTRQIVKLLTDPSRAEIFFRSLPKEERFLVPFDISLDLIVDLSGSMNEGNKRREVQKTVYLLLQSLRWFYRDLLNRLAIMGKKGKNFAHPSLRVIGFGDTLIPLFSFPEKYEIEDEEKWTKALLLCLAGIGREDLGRTKDAPALKDSLDSLRKRIIEEKRGSEKTRLFLVFEITDGQTQTEEESAQLVKQLNNLPNVYAKGIQIERGESRGTFERVWGQHGKRLENISQLSSVIIYLLQEAIKSSLLAKEKGVKTYDLPKTKSPRIVV